MATTWTKIKLWTKVSVFGAVAIYVIAFILANRECKIKPPLRFFFVPSAESGENNALVVLVLTGVFSILGWWLLKTVFKTVRQLREARKRGELDRKNKELDDMMAKASKLQTKPEKPAE